MAELPQRSTYSTPGWVKVLGIIIVVLALLVGLIVVIGGEHGPSRHAPSRNHNNETPFLNSTEEHMPPTEHGGH
ncbi:MAG: hypothetical protein K8I82_29560 [Anaerolineae bacterium]|nr:hypothetical protein [Anaerolineae bacterium]